MTAMQPLLITHASDLSSYDSCGILASELQMGGFVLAPANSLPGFGIASANHEYRRRGFKRGKSQMIAFANQQYNRRGSTREEFQLIAGQGLRMGCTSTNPIGLHRRRMCFRGLLHLRQSGGRKARMCQMRAVTEVGAAG